MFFYKVTIDNDSENPVYYLPLGSGLTLSWNIVSVERVDIPACNYDKPEDSIQDDYNLYMFCAFLLVKHNRRIDAIKVMRRAKILMDDSLKNCKKITDAMTMFSTYEKFVEFKNNQ